MPRMTPRRTFVGVRLLDEEIEAIDERALDEGLTIRGGEPNRSEMLRRALAYGMARMPRGWQPKPQPK